MALSDDVAALQTAVADVSTLTETVVTDVESTAPSPADEVLSAVVTALEAAGYVVTPPQEVAPSTDAPTA